MVLSHKPATTEERIKDAFDLLLDDRIAMYGMINTIQFLFDMDFSDDEIIEFGFETSDIQYAHELDAIHGF